MNLFQIQPEIKGEWYTVGFIYGSLMSVDHLIVYDTDYPAMNVTIGFMSRHVDLAPSELESMMEFELFPVLRSGELHHIPNTQWAVELR